jgi:hypothetical protein
VGGLAVADREDDVVTLVALYALEVLDEERLGPVLVEERERVVVEPTDRTTHGILDPRRVGDARAR